MINSTPGTDALQHLFTQHYRSLSQLSFSIVKDMDAAKDIVQDFFIKYWEMPDKRKLNLKFEAYAFIAVKNRSLNYIASEKVKQQREILYGSILPDVDYAQTEATNERIENYKIRLIKTIDKLPDKRRIVFLLSAVEGLKYSEIAERLNISINTVKTQIRKAYLFIHRNCDSTTILFLIASFIRYSHLFSNPSC